MVWPLRAYQDAASVPGIISRLQGQQQACHHFALADTTVAFGGAPAFQSSPMARAQSPMPGTQQYPGFRRDRRNLHDAAG